jgi:hypothetical protein
MGLVKLNQRLSEPSLQVNRHEGAEGRLYKFTGVGLGIS